MIPSDSLVSATNVALADKNFRDSVRQMHAANYPLVDMVDALGLEDDMTTEIRQLLEDLPADVVDGIRKATIEMLDSANYVMPLRCAITDSEIQNGVPIEVSVLPELGRHQIHIRPGAPT